MAKQDWKKVDRTQDLVDYVYAKYGNSENESEEATDQMLDNLYNFSVMKEKYLSMVESEKEKAKMMVSDEMVEYVLAKYGNNWNFKDEIADAEHDKGKAKQEEHDLDDVDLDHADLNGLDLENRVKKLEDDFSRMLKAKKAKEADDAESKVSKEVVQVSSDEGFSGDEDVMCFNDVKYPLTDAEIRMFKDRPTTSRALTRKLASTLTRSKAPSIRSRAPIASISIRSRAPTASHKIQSSHYFHFQCTSCFYFNSKRVQENRYDMMCTWFKSS
uniref:Uncharacterized protein n=1 Tax=Tanacetum cinerariifolium TaxID=118510 RepID=A0A6L2LI75_TANCI|nr:hypothetical protein [Tanacetum cinerariifolium]